MAYLEKDNRNLLLEISQMNNNAMIIITENDRGIAQNNLTTIFNPGFTTKSSGYGLGLHSSPYYIQEMRGEISSQSPGFGKASTITITLSINQSPYEI